MQEPPQRQMAVVQPHAAPPVMHPRAADGLDLADYIYGPPPRTHVDPRLRCRFDCPKYPPGSLTPIPR